MKASTFLNWKTALVLASVPFVAAWLQGSPSAASSSDTAPTVASSDTTAAADATTGADISSSTAPDSANATDASGATQPSSANAPAGMKLYGGTAEVVKMAQAGIGDEVMLAYITNANVRFGVTSDQIIYLNDLGVSGTVVTAMMQHDAAASSAAVQNPPPAAVPPATLTPATAPGMDYTNSSPQTADDNGMAGPPPDNMNYADSGAPYPGDGTMADDTDYFYSPLQPYGTWIYVVGCGMCWQPTVCLRDHAWRPYCDRGRWLYSDCGWYWQSDYSWGWAAFHYGRWFCDNNRGWVWHPNRVWGPAWVAWRQSEDHCGWAPLPPAAVFVPGTGFRFHNQAVSASSDFGMSAGLFTFIPIERFSDYAPSRYAAAPWQAARIFGESKPLNGVTYRNQQVANLGMDPREADQRAGVRVRRAVIQEMPETDANGRVQPDRLGRRGGSLVILRPQLPSAPGQHGTGPAAGGAGAAMPGHGGFISATGAGGNSWNSRPSTPSRTPTVLGTAGSAAYQTTPGSDGASHVHVYQVAHEAPIPAGTVTWSSREPPPGPTGHTMSAGTYLPNSMVMQGQRNLTNPQWNSAPGQPSYGVQNQSHREGSTVVYTVTPGTQSHDVSEGVGSSRATGGGRPAGYSQNNVNPYYHGPVMAVATPGTMYAAPGYNYHQSTYAPAPTPQPTYHTAPQPHESYSAPQQRETSPAPQTHESYSAPSQSSSSHGSSYSQPSSSSSSYSSSSSSSSTSSGASYGSSRGR